MSLSRLPAVINLFASFDGREKGAVENVSRELRKEGLLTQGKRGVGAPFMGVKDYTNLLLSYGSRRATDAPECVRRLRYCLLMAEESLKFAERLPFSKQAKDADGLFRAGDFLDAMLARLSIDGARAFQIDTIQYWLDAVEIHDAVNGIGVIKVLFHDDDFEYNDILEFRYHERTNADPKIQNAAIISDEIIWKIAESIRGEEID